MNLTDGIILVGMTNIFNLENHLKVMLKEVLIQFNPSMYLLCTPMLLKMSVAVECKNWVHIYLIPSNFESLTIAIVH